ncbi:M30 family metallopeptidase [Macrococcus capreoli]|uniref:hypothetical protein n=1 Tax=Macrococcus capreoli TaxID=2982690 RepID=UPI0021D58E70|nr:hypothetical protein [Macrococcus sp. TMW 2.2395]MCU7557661.1 hypothetical protein [Macrococcus sp. TMW 2.2395]
MKKFSKTLSSALIVSTILSSTVVPAQFAQATTVQKSVATDYRSLTEGGSLIVRDVLYERHNVTYKGAQVEGNQVKITFDYQSKSIIKEGSFNARLLVNEGTLKELSKFTDNVKYQNSTTLEYKVDVDALKDNDGYIYIDLSAANKADVFSQNTQRVKVTVPDLSSSPEEPTTEEPTTEEPTTENPTTEEPTSETPDKPQTGSGTVIVNNELVSESYADAQPTGFNQLESIVQRDLKLIAPKKPYMIDRPFEISDRASSASKISKSQSPLRYITNYNLGDKKTFTTINMSGGREVQEKTTGSLEYKGSKAYVWVADPKVSRADAEKVGKEFDNRIAPLIHNNFGEESDLDGNGKVNILLFDIKDGFGVSSYGYIGGYFDGTDLLNEPGSNKGEIFYMDTYPSMGYDPSLEENTPRNVERIYSTLAHEFQHMVNFNSQYLKQNRMMETYLNEAFSMAAEHIYSGPIEDRIDYYNNSSYIQNGHSLTIWSRSGDTLSNYSLSYLFGQYLNEQARNHDGVYKEILNYQGTPYDALQNAIHKYVDPTKSVGQFMTDFRVALLKHDKSGKYSLGSESEFQNLKTLYADRVPAQLRPQGAVAIRVNDLSQFKVPTNKGKNITYTKVSDK